MNNRKDKINLLKGLLSGTKTIDELRPLRAAKIFYKREDEDFYKEPATGKIYHVTSAELHKLFPRHPIIVCTFKWDDMVPKYNQE